MGGYTLYRKILALEKLRRRAGWFSAAFPALGRLPIGERMCSYLRRAGETIQEHYRGVVKGIGRQTRLGLTSVERIRKCETLMHEVFDPYYGRVGNASPLNQMLYVDAKVWLPEDLLLKADKMTMATGVELRVPFLDHKLVEYIAGLPDDLKVRGNQGKWILRQAMGTLLPPSVLHRTKKGFPMPARSWLRFELRDFVRDTLLARNSACRQFFQPAAVERIVNLQERGKLDGFQEAWSLLAFEFWHRHFIEKFEPAYSVEPSTVEVDVFA
jgi:asparagine synthase (glutamine-hydrolysing)